MKSPPRRKPTRDERQASAYLQIKRGDGTPIVSRDEARHLTAREVIETFESRVHWHHNIEHGIGGTMHPTNLEPITPDEHKKIPSKTRVAKARRISEAHEEFRRRILAKSGQSELPPKPQRKAKPMPGTKASGWKHKVNGEWVRR